MTDVNTRLHIFSPLNFIEANVPLLFFFFCSRRQYIPAQHLINDRNQLGANIYFTFICRGSFFMHTLTCITSFSAISVNGRLPQPTCWFELYVPASTSWLKALIAVVVWIIRWVNQFAKPSVLLSGVLENVNFTYRSCLQSHYFHDFQHPGEHKADRIKWKMVNKLSAPQSLLTFS